MKTTSPAASSFRLALADLGPDEESCGGVSISVYKQPDTVGWQATAQQQALAHRVAAEVLDRMAQRNPSAETPWKVEVYTSPATPNVVQVLMELPYPECSMTIEHGEAHAEKHLDDMKRIAEHAARSSGTALHHINLVPGW